MVSRLTLYTGGVGFTIARAGTVRISVWTFTVRTIAVFTVCVCIVNGQLLSQESIQGKLYKVERHAHVHVKIRLLTQEL